MRFCLLLFSLMIGVAVQAQVKYKTVPVPPIDGRPIKRPNAPQRVIARPQAKNVVDIVYSSPVMKRFAQLLKTTDTQTYRNGTYTIFAPSDTAMAHLPVGIAGKMYDPHNNASTADIVKYHVLRGKYSDADIVNAIKNADGYAVFITVLGKKVVFSMVGDYVKMRDEEGHVANVLFSHSMASNGMVHVIDKVMMPKD